MNPTHSYNVSINWLEGRKGIMQSNVLNDAIEVATPPEFAKGIPRIWSPEHLFVAAAASCYMTTFLAVAEKSRLEFLDFCCNATGILETKDNSMLISSITLQPVVKVSQPEMVTKALKILDLAHQSCLILNSVKSEIIFMPKVECNSNFHCKISNPH